QRNDGRRFAFAANVDVQRGAERSGGWSDVGHRNRLIERRRKGAGGDRTDGLFALHYLAAFTGDSFPGELQTGAFFPIGSLRDLLQCGFTDEIGLLELHGEVQSGGERVDLFREFMAVERHGGFQAKRIAGAETTRPPIWADSAW